MSDDNGNDNLSDSGNDTNDNDNDYDNDNTLELMKKGLWFPNLILFAIM